MFNFLTSIKENNKEGNLLAKAVFVINNAIDNELAKVQEQQIAGEIFVLAYITKIGVLDRIKTLETKFKWRMDNTICIPTLINNGKMDGPKFVSLFTVIDLTVVRLPLLADEFGLSKEVREILEGEGCYHQVEKGVPDHVKEILNMINYKL